MVEGDKQLNIIGSELLEDARDDIGYVQRSRKYFCFVRGLSN